MDAEDRILIVDDDAEWRLIKDRPQEDRVWGTTLKRLAIKVSLRELFSTVSMREKLKLEESMSELNLSKTETL